MSDTIQAPAAPAAPAVSIPLDQPAAPVAPTSYDVGSIMSRFNEQSSEKAAEKAAEIPKSGETAPTEKPNEPAAKVESPEPKEGEKGWMTTIKKKADKADQLEKTLSAKETELAELKSKLESAKPADVELFQKKLEETERKIAEKEKVLEQYEQERAVNDIHRSKAWKETIEAPFGEIGRTMDRLGQTYGVDPNDLKDALTISDPKLQYEKLESIMSEAGFNEIHKTKVYSAVDESQKLMEKSAEMEANAFKTKQELEYIKHQESEKTQKQKQAELKVATSTVADQMRKHLPELFSNEEVASDITNADFTTEDPTMRAYNGMAGKALVHLTKDLRAKTARIQELEKIIADRNSVSPKAGGGQSNQHTDTSTKAPEGGSMWDRARSAGIAVAR